jgi:hypothetical protein
MNGSIPLNFNENFYGTFMEELFFLIQNGSLYQDGIFEILK